MDVNNFELLIDKILNKINIEGNISSDEIYDMINYKNDKCEFDNKSNQELTMFLIYLKHKQDNIKNIQTVWKCFSLIDIPTNISYDEFCHCIQKYKDIPLPEEDRQLVTRASRTDLKNSYDVIINFLGNFVFYSNFCWRQISSEKINGRKAMSTGKIYLELNNNQIHKFAKLLLEECLINEIYDFSFKFNDDETTSRRDSVVIYFNEQNFEKYIRIIEKIHDTYSEFDFKSSNCIAYKYNDYIYVGKDEESVSYTETIVHLIINLLKEGCLDKQLIASETNKFIDVYLESIINLCNKTKENSNNSQSSYKQI